MKAANSIKGTASLIAVCAGLMMGTSAAQAQEATTDAVAVPQDPAQPVGTEPPPGAIQTTIPPSSAPATDAAEDIVVTGTLVRGVQPVGSAVIAVGAEQIQKLGTTDTTQLLTRIPQLSSFGQLPTPIGNSAGIIRPPQVRGLPTLILFNGQRLSPVGLLSSDPNVNAIPPSLIERVEVIPGGGSALYGSDAVGGVINFIPRRTVDGFELRAHGALGDDYRTSGVDLNFGTKWDSGSVILAYSLDHHSRLAGADRDWFTQDPLGTGFTNTLCSPGNLTAGGRGYLLPNLTPGTQTCDLDKVVDIFPNYNRHSFYASMRQDFGTSVHFDGSAFVAFERLRSQGTYLFGDSNLDASGTITSNNPFFHPVAGETSQTFVQLLDGVGAPYGLGRNSNRYSTLGITPKLTIDLPANWRAVASFNYGRSEVRTQSRNVNTTALASALAATTTATAYNPYDPGSTNSNVLQAVLGTTADSSHGIQVLTQSRLVLDGALLTLPGGDIKVAAGYEHLSYNIKSGALLNSPYDAPNPLARNSRNIESVFGEIVVPLVGGSNAMSGIQKLELSTQVRHDSFSDGFGTTNPKIGLNYSPIQGVNIHGSWGKSFNAPDLAFSTGLTQVQVRPSSTIIFPADIPQFGNAGRLEFILAGANPGSIQPETSESWQVGADVSPSGLRGLRASATYFQIKYNNRIDYPPLFPPGLAARPFFVLNPTLAQLQAATAGFAFDAPVDLPSLYNNPSTTPYAIITAYPQNVANVRERGIDFDLSYNSTTGFGSIRGQVAGTYYLRYRTQASPTLPYTSNLSDAQPKVSFQASAGATAGKVSADVRVDYRGSAPLANSPLVPRVDSYVTTNAFLSYDVGDVGFLKGTQITLNVDNIFDVDPPIQLSSTGTAFTNIGRLATLSLRTAF